MSIQEGVINAVNEWVWAHICRQGEGVYLVHRSMHVWGTVNSEITHELGVRFQKDDNYICKFRIKKQTDATRFKMFAQDNTTGVIGE